MPFQSTVYSTQAVGKPGTIARQNPLTRIPMIAEGTAVFAGGFILKYWAPVPPPNQKRQQTLLAFACLKNFKWHCGVVITAMAWPHWTSIQAKNAPPLNVAMSMFCLPLRPSMGNQFTSTQPPAKFRRAHPRQRILLIPDGKSKPAMQQVRLAKFTKFKNDNSWQNLK